jgi:uncharacterized protein YcnI
LVRGAGVLAVVGAALVVAAQPAWAHVTLHSYEAQQAGSDAVVQIRVPNEEDNATTTQLEVDFPADTPLIGLYVEPTPGWQFQVTTSNLPKPVTNDDGTFTQYVSKVVWSGGSIPVGGFMDFNIDVSDLPDVPTIEVKALQTYSNGDIVRWIDPPATGNQPEPPHPAPTLDLTPAPASGGSSPSTTAPAAGGTAATGTTAAAGTAAATTASDHDSTSTVAIIALVVAVVALIVTVIALVRGRRTAAP